jgi:hypothetical protein
MDRYKINHRVTTPYHPQANGQVEGTNKILEAIITNTVKLHLKDWADNSLKLYGPTRKHGGLLLIAPYELVYENRVLLVIETNI